MHCRIAFAFLFFISFSHSPSRYLFLSLSLTLALSLALSHSLSLPLSLVVAVNISSHTHPYSFSISFPLRSDMRVAIWTTTPWTIPANLAVAVNRFLYSLYNHTYLIQFALFIYPSFLLLSYCGLFPSITMIDLFL